MKVLVVSVSTGGGHNAAGRAVFEELGARGVEAEFLDLFSLVGERLSQKVGDTYAFIVNRMPDVFRCMYRAGDAIRSDRRKSPVYWANRLCRDRLSAHLEEGRFDAVVTPHLFPAETLTSLRREGRLKVPTMAVATDYTCIPFWEETDLDEYVIPHPDLEEEFIRHGLPGYKLRSWGIPVGAAFRQAGERGAARAQLALEGGGPLALVMMGSTGFGDVQPLVDGLLDQGVRAAVIAGGNAALRSALEERFGGVSRVRVLGFTQEVARYMEACDLLLTKPGGLTSTEAAVKGIPLVFTDPIPGCETVNARFFERRGMALVGVGARQQLACVRRLLEDEGARARMLEAQRANARPEAASRIAERLISARQ